MNTEIKAVSFVIKYFKRFPVQQLREDGTYGCRGCGGKIPPRRQSWCSTDCVNKFHPARVVFFARQRDGGICQICRGDISLMMAEWKKQQPQYPNVFYNSLEGQAAFQKYHQHLKAWKSQCPKAQYDHIIPFSEGGLTILQNIRTLCGPCHKRRTKDWHKTRKAAKALPDKKLLRNSVMAGIS